MFLNRCILLENTNNIAIGINANINNFNNIYIIFQIKNFSSCTFEIKKLISLKG